MSFVDGIPADHELPELLTAPDRAGILRCEHGENGRGAPARRTGTTIDGVPMVIDVFDEVLREAPAGGFARRLGTERIETTDRGRAAVESERSRQGSAEDRT